MKRFAISLLCFIFFAAMPAFSYNVNHFTDDFVISDALELLKTTNANEVFDNLEENSVKIMFYDLSLISYSYRDHYAINGYNNMGDRCILINTKYKNAPKEEIACLIAHESCHKAKVATLEEETLATQTEAKYWLLLKHKGVLYQNDDLTQRLNNLAYLYKTSTPSKNNIETRIANSPFYRDQLALKND